LSGPRLLAQLSSTHGLLTNAASTLSCGTPSVPERITQVIEERRRAEKRITDLELELAKNIANGMMLGMNAMSDNTRPIYTKHVHRVDDTTNGQGFLNAISLAFIAEQSSSPYLFVLSSSPSSQTPTSANVIVVFGSDEKKVKDAGEALKSRLSVKGGGKGARWSGKFTGVWKQGREDSIVEDVLRNI
jgi:misacylated tRNA(Ala) deacylase